MKFGKKDNLIDKSTIIFNESLVLTQIPLETYNYVVNGKPALEWVIENYQIYQDPLTKIINDPNDWGIDSNEPDYILNLVKKVITVSINSKKIINELPKFDEF
jgi:predicted helicase